VESTGPFMATLGPLYYRPVEGGVIIALRIAEKHLNRRGIAHGGMLVTLADSAMGMNLARAREPRLWTVTTSLSTEFVDAARRGDWVEAHVDILKLGRRLAYANCYLIVGAKRILRASGVFAVVRPARPDESSEG
jgi:uncharacterized protein (TIGR00369 family)